MTSVSNPLLRRSGLPFFDKISPEHIEPAVTKTLEEAYLRLEALESNMEPTWEGLIKPMEEMSKPFEYAWGPVGHLLNVKNSEELRNEHMKMLPKVVDFGLRLGQSKPIYHGLQAIRDGDNWNELDEAQKRVIKLKIRDADHSGVGLKGEEKKRFNEISKRLSKLGTDFSNHVLDATKAYEFIITEAGDTEGWPNTLKLLSSQGYVQAKEKPSTPEGGPWRISLEAPLVVPFLQHSKVRSHRETVLKAYVSRADEGEHDNKPLIWEILKLREELAGLLGFDTFAQYSLASKMAPSIESVQSMFRELFDASKPYLFEEFKELEGIAEEMGQKEKIEHWDTAFWSERFKERKFQFTDEQLRPYFPIPKVLEGMFGLAESLFGVTIKESNTESHKWHNDVTFFKVYENEKQIASFYLDPYSRPGEKRGGAWMDNCLIRRIIDGKVRLPVVYLNANGSPPVGDKPSLLSFKEVTTLFHEFGHGLQGMLTTVDYPMVAGIRGIEWDAVEIMSQFMENWCYHEPVLRTISGHWKTNEKLPDDLVKKLLEARVYKAATSMLRQLEFGLTDLELHSTFDPHGETNVFDVHMRIAATTNVLKPMPNNHFLCAFTHIFSGGYAAGYYSYKWAEVLSADLFSVFKDTKAQRMQGRNLRKSFLALGGSVEPMKIFKEFMGRKPSTEALLRQYNLL